MEPRTAKRPFFDNHHFKTFFCCKERRLGPGTYDRKLIFFIYRRFLFFARSATVLAVILPPSLKEFLTCRQVEVERPNSSFEGFLRSEQIRQTAGV